MPNHLASETSPYLLQHKDNPVDWHPWGEEALARARAEEKPIFLSIGYAACHWCHVMEHESFENPDIAQRLNRDFVSIKVDREERPDLDAIYMNAVHLYFQMIGSPQGGGWPLSMFLTPEGEPFFGGTYWPPQSAYNRPGFVDVLHQVADAWREKKDEIRQQAGHLTSLVQRVSSSSGSPGVLKEDLLTAAGIAFERRYDARHGGISGAPKFPHPTDLRVLLRLWKRTGREGPLRMVTHTLDKMAAGGIYDQLGGGFHRYSVDERWLVPHFEKMLYDNAMLTSCYVETYQITGDEQYARVARQTLDYVLREMTHEQGGFFSTQDADSQNSQGESEEGAFYVWTPAQIEEVLGAEQAKTFCRVYDVSEEGNFEGKSILNLPKTLDQCVQILQRDLEELESELSASRAKLLEVRGRRWWPGLDDKILLGWNGLMIDALSLASGALNEPRYLQAATAAADFLLNNMRRSDGRLLHSWRNGQAKLDAYLDDYACLINALVSLYEAGCEERFIDAGVELADMVQKHFADDSEGGYFYTADDHEQLIARQKEAQDNPTPSGNGMIATALFRLGRLCGRSEYTAAAESAISAHVELLQEHPIACGQMMLALDLHLGPAHEIVLLGQADDESTQAALADLRHRFWPGRLLAFRDPQEESQDSGALKDLFAGKSPQEDVPTAFICQDNTCGEPIHGAESIKVHCDQLLASK